MADEFNTSGNWWDSTSRSRFESGTSSSSGLNNSGSFGWPTDMADIKARTNTMDSMSSVSGSSVVFQEPQKLQGHESAGGGDPSLQMMGLGLSTQAMDWNQSLLRGEKAADSSFRAMLQENLNSNTNFQQETGMGSSQVQWRSEKMFSGMSGGESSSNEFKQLNRGFSLDQPSFSPQYSSGDSTVTCQGLPSSFQMDSSAMYGSPSTILQGLLGPDSNQHQQPSFENRPMNFSYPANYGVNSSELLPSWSAKVPPFLRSSPPKQTVPHNQLHFSNNAPFWNASEAAMKGFFPLMQQQFPTTSFEEKPKNISEVRDSSTVVKKSGSEATSKRPRNETQTPLPAFKVRKEKMGDRITALQQLVSPFGKTDTASVLSEAIEYIKFLHEQVSVLSTPYMKSGAPIQHQQNSDKSKDPEGPKQDLRSRGLCLVPVSSTFPVTHETTVDFWTPTFGGTFR
ncbi:hypothetical protein RGQ29_027092 [Quercus rubra]|uniref:BHLH domain-containing protein n=1 Tax=Quercus rubra TaxID=3512 RepID=A0AAN7EPE8_QUERU|nr:hypothetical protein RGQ29_027092 [Quercus rubra]